MRRTTAAFVLATGLLVTACSSADEGGATDEGDPSATTSSATTDESASADPSASADDGSGDDVPADQIRGLALTAAEFPAPYQFTELPPGALESGSEAVGGALAGAEFTPAECGAATQATQGADLSQAGVGLANDPATQATVVSVLSPAPDQAVDFEEIAETCSSFTFTLTGPDGASLEGDATLELLPEPSVEADSARAASTTVSVSLGGQEQTVETVIYAAELRGVSVIASGTALAGGGTVDQDVLAELLATGVEKVRAF